MLTLLMNFSADNVNRHFFEVIKIDIKVYLNWVAEKLECYEYQSILFIRSFRTLDEP